MEELKTYILENWETITGIAGAVVVACSGVAALTPNTYDNKIMNALRKLIDLIALNVGKAKNEKKK